MTEERRYKLLPLTTEDLLGCFLSRTPDRLIVFKAFHEDVQQAEVRSIEYSPMYASWLLLLWHPEWPEVQMGYMIPVIEAPFRLLFNTENLSVIQKDAS